MPGPRPRIAGSSKNCPGKIRVPATCRVSEAENSEDHSTRRRNWTGWTGWTGWISWISEHAYLLLAAGAALVLTRTVDFSPPPLVRLDESAHGGVVGSLPVQEFSDQLRSPQVAQIKATLRRYDDPDLAVTADSHELDDRGEVLSQPVVTTPLGTGAAIEQTIRLERGKLELDLQIHATPRLGRSAGPAGPTGGAEPVTRLEHQISIHSRREGWSGRERRVHLDTGGTLDDVEARGHRLVFSVDQHLFSLDLELHRPLGAV